MSETAEGFLIGAAIWCVGWLIAHLLYRRREERRWIREADAWNVRFPYLPIETSTSLREKIMGN